MEKAKLDRINELARKAKTVGLTDEETVERAALRQEYIEAFRAGTRATLESILIQEKDGTLTPLKKRSSEETRKHHHYHPDHDHHHHDHEHGHCCCGHDHDHNHNHHQDDDTIPEQ
ncbi:MAG: DUF896 domain-containing protein [Clostridia bacterium]